MHESNGKSLILSTARNEIKLWDGLDFNRDPLCFSSHKSACFHPSGRLVAATQARQAATTIVDLTAHATVLCLEMEEGEIASYTLEAADI